MDEKLDPAVREVIGNQQPPPEAAPQFFQVEVLVIRAERSADCRVTHDLFGDRDKPDRRKEVPRCRNCASLTLDVRLRERAVARAQVFGESRERKRRFPGYCFLALTVRAKIGQKFLTAAPDLQTERPCFQGLSSSGGRI